MKVFTHLLLVALSLNAFAVDWPQWLGPQRDGIIRETELIERFPENGPPVRWRKPINGGYSGPAVANGCVFVMDRKQGAPLERKPGERGLPELPGEERILCLDERTGDTLWEHKYDAAYRIDFPSGPRATPVIDAGRVYTLGAMGDLKCLDAKKGGAIWSRNFPKEFGVQNPQAWGWAAHPLIHEDKLIAMVGGTNSAVVAFDKNTGAEVWRALSTREIGYAQPVIANVAGKDQLIVWHTEAICGLRPGSGEVIWSVAYPIEGKHQRPEVTIAMPRVKDDLLFVTSFYHGALMLKFTEEKADVLWNKKSTSRSSFNAGLHTTMTTPILHDGHIYGVCGTGELRCLAIETGGRVWETRDHLHGQETMFGTSFLMQIGENSDRFFLWTDLGDLIIAKLTPAKYEEISRVHLLDAVENARGRDVVWSHPAVANKSFFARNQQEIICVSLEAHFKG